MSEPAAREKPDFIEKIADYAGWILAVSVAVIIIVWSFYFFRFRGGLSDDTAIWGQFGDFVGGTLNSVFAFFSFMILLSSLRLQLKELRLTREELEATRKELAASSTAQRRQASHFETEAKKNDHTFAISQISSFVSDILLKTSNFAGVNGVHQKFNTSHYNSDDGIIEEALHGKENFDLFLQYIIILDYHCSMLFLQFRESPALIRPLVAYENYAVCLEANGWIDELEFFGKHDLPYNPRI